MTNVPEHEQRRRFILVQNARAMILNTLPIEDESDTGLMMAYKGFYLQVDFSYLHPLMVMTFLRRLEGPPRPDTMKLVNELNRNSLIGCHTIGADVGVYSYRAAHWLDTDLSKSRFLEVLDRCFDETSRAFGQIHSPH